MNVRIVALTLLLVAPASLAQGSYTTTQTKAAERAALLESLQRGKEIDVHGERYQHLPEVFAVERKSGAQTSQETANLVGAGAAQVIETKGAMVLYRGGGKATGALVQRVGGSTVYPTVLNVRAGTLGVLTGTLIVKPRSMADTDAIGASHGLEKTKVYPKLQTVFYRVKAGADIADVSAALQADPMVESAYPEIIERVRTAK